MKNTSKIDQLGMIKLPQEMCKALELEEGSSVYISTEAKKAVLRNSIKTMPTFTRKLDEFNRIVVPRMVKKHLDVEPNDIILLELAEDAIILTRA